MRPPPGLPRPLRGAPRPRRLRTAACALLAALAGAAAGAGCGGDSAAESAARAYLEDVDAERYAEAARRTDGPRRQIAERYRTLAAALGIRKLTLELGEVEEDGDRASARFDATVTLGGLGTWRYAGRLPLRKSDDRWLVAWSPAVIHPRLRPGYRLSRRRDLPERAPLLDRAGRPLFVPTPVVTVGVVPGDLKDRREALAVLRRTTGADPRRVRRLIKRSKPDWFVPVITLRRPAYERVKPTLYPVPGVRFREAVYPLPPTPGFGGPVLGQVGPATAEALKEAGPHAAAEDVVGLSGLQLVFQRRLAGRASGAVELLDGKGRRRATLFSVRGSPGRSVRTTLSRPLQAAAERALRGGRKPAALVAVRASTGALLAVANKPARAALNRAFEGRYPPGSTFKVVSTAALLRRGFDPRSTVRCPAAVTVGGRRFRNFEGEAAGTVPFRTDFAQSCNAAFVSLSRRLRPGDLPRTARSFGFGARLRLPLPAYSGQVPAPRDAAERAAAMIGQGRVLASPLTMALVAAAVDSGTWRPPTLVTEPRRPSGARPARLEERVTRTLRPLMRAVVTEGTGRAAEVPGAPVHGKTGTAEFGPGTPPRTHAWFIGFRGDLALAVLVEDGGVGGRVAAPVAARFLREAG